jgi:S-adenosylmethionine:tRNA ribosyltransferase-isomerase
MHPAGISIRDYTYLLPETAIAYYPLAERDASRLLVYRRGEMIETTYRNIGAELPDGAVLVFNNTKVVEARIVFQKATGGKIEIFCLEPPPEYGGMAAAMAQTGKVRWKCLIGGASKWKPGQVLTKTVGGTGLSTLGARYVGRLEDAFLIEFSWEPATLSFVELLHHAGLIPLPPYIHRAPEVSDTERYQTVYARYEGSVAAPTAGLHFTARVFDDLRAKGIRKLFVTLHVGAGTFMPVKAATLEEHIMHTEFIDVERGTIVDLSATVKAGRPVIPIGTTSARTIESLYWLGQKTFREPGIGLDRLIVRQWDPYDEGTDLEKHGDEVAGTAGLSTAEALEALLGWMERQELQRLVTSTQLLIAPGYRWKVVSGLITNFHQPESTLLLLVASLIGEDWRKVYEYALLHGFRFLSYGDGCLLLR